MVRIVAGRSSAGKSGYIMARFQINATPIVSLPKSETIPDGAVVHFPLIQQIELKNGDKISAENLLNSIKHQHPETEVDFLYCGHRELFSRQQMRKHTEFNLTGYQTKTANGIQNKVAYQKQLLIWLERLKSFGWNVNLIHSHHGKYYVRDEAHFHRVLAEEESLLDRFMYFSGIQKPVATRGWGLPPHATRSS